MSLTPSAVVRRTVLTAVVAGLTVVAAPGPAHACTPHVQGSGPTVYVTPDYSHPLQSDIGYDTSDTDVLVVTCL